MPLPQPSFNVEPSERVRSLRKQREQRQRRSIRAARFRAVGWEMTGRLAVNLGLSLVALSALVRLVPYHHTQLQVLHEVETSVESLRSQNQRLLEDFSRSFDPAQPSQVLQENGARESEQHIPIVWVDALPPEAEAESEPVE
ncbi:MAG: hypothetical protein ACFB0G_01945 [Leptolyngbyaceae cyanobacterium]